MTILIDAILSSSLVHGGGTDDSNIVLFRRESIIQPDGKIVKCPVFSGNAVRGVLRRAGAWLLSDRLGWADNPPSRKVLRIVSSGGALIAEPALPVDLHNLTRRLPHLSLFGGSWGGSIHQGSLVVGKLLPVCAETAHITGIPSDMRVGRLLDLEQYVRHDGGPVSVDVVDGEHDDGNQMIYQVETLSAGVRVVGVIDLRPWATSDDNDWLHACLRHIVETGGHFGGRSATGHGRIDLSPLVDGAAADRGLQFVTDHADDYRAVFDAIR